MSDLLPCPFCGGTKLQCRGDDKYVAIFCDDCGASGPDEYGLRDWNMRSSAAESALRETKSQLVKAVQDIRVKAAECVQFDKENLEAITDEENRNPSNSLSVRYHWRTRLALSESWQQFVDAMFANLRAY